MGIIHLIIFLAIGGKIAAGQEPVPEGERIFIKDAPYFVSIRSATQHVCGGVLMRDDLVFTSSRCVSYDRKTVVSGVDENNPSGTVHQVAFFSHQGSPSFALIELSNPIGIDGVAEIVSMPLYELSYNETAHFISFQPETAQLRRTEVTIAPWHVCSMDEDMLCATRKFNRAIQSSEIGGPLIHHGRLIGIAAHWESLNEGYDVYVDFLKLWKEDADNTERFRARGQ